MYLDVCIAGINLSKGVRLPGGSTVKIVGFPTTRRKGTFLEVENNSKLYQGVIPIGACQGRLDFFFDQDADAAEIALWMSGACA